MTKQNATLWLLLALLLAACGGVQKNEDGGAPGGGEDRPPAAEGTREAGAQPAGEQIGPTQAKWLCGQFGAMDQSKFAAAARIRAFAWCSQFGSDGERFAYKAAARAVAKSPEEKALFASAFDQAGEKKLTDVPRVFDYDDDGIFVDWCPGVQNTGRDSDNDGYDDACDNCRDNVNKNQSDNDRDGIGDACDNCRDNVNKNQSDNDRDGIGDACDNCRDVKNGEPAVETCDPNKDGTLSEAESSACKQANADGDKPGDACDNAPRHRNDDQKDEGDGDGVGDAGDNCPKDSNADQKDGDNDGVGDKCDFCPEDPKTTSEEDAEDGDGDGVPNCKDNASGVFNPAQLDTDQDTLVDELDNCPGKANGPAQVQTESVGNQTDTDGDGLGDACDDSPGVKPAPAAEVESGAPTEWRFNLDRRGTAYVIIFSPAFPWQNYGQAQTMLASVKYDDTKQLRHFPTQADLPTVMSAFIAAPEQFQKISSCVWTGQTLVEGGKNFVWTIKIRGRSSRFARSSVDALCGVVVIVEPKRDLH